MRKKIIIIVLALLMVVPIITTVEAAKWEEIKSLENYRLILSGKNYALFVFEDAKRGVTCYVFRQTVPTLVTKPEIENFSLSCVKTGTAEPDAKK